MSIDLSSEKHLKKPDSSSLSDTFRGLCSARVLSLMILSGVSSFPQAGYTQEVSKANINPSEIGAISVKPGYDYEGMLLEAFEGDIEISDSLRIAINAYVEPLHQVLINKDLGEALEGSDIANIVVLAMMKQQKHPDFSEQYDSVAASFPNPDLDSAWRAKLAELFKN